MKIVKVQIVFILFFTLIPAMLYSQNFAEKFIDRFSYHFDQSSNKLVDLAKAMPEDTYTWAPDEETMTVAQVFMHISRHNYTLPSIGLDIDIPEDVDAGALEKITDKDIVIKELKKSIDHVSRSIEKLSSDDLEKQTELFGETVESWAVLMLLITHMSEHVGQAISYARMNGIAPPWSR